MGKKAVATLLAWLFAASSLAACPTQQIDGLLFCKEIGQTPRGAIQKGLVFKQRSMV
ncbi:hypothetical protein [uncultured Acetatifactor sp.]|uniref:hypothetical protein n=1 Tax=uncultured Acetatifactor sp. TaxID=1671927 RepID=UPI002615EDB1|nr:hypothetical protein [uncultured Acetatifactor sp.]